MSCQLLLCISQDDDDVIPYRFKMTNINVYSFEEALYHCYHHWKQSVDDFFSDEFIGWINNELSLSFIASKVKSISLMEGFSNRFIHFLTIIDYFDENQINKLKTKLVDWETRLEWEKLKERADALMKSKEPEKAYMLYKRSLIYSENAEIYNNMGIALMQLELFENAVTYLKKAFAFDRENIKIILNLAEATIYSHDFENAVRLLKLAEGYGDHPDIHCLYGELNFETGNYMYAIDYFQRALALKEDVHYIYRLADVYVKLRLYDKAFEIMDRVKIKNSQFLLKQADVYRSANNFPGAIKAIERALTENKKSIELWTRLAMLRRLDYDLPKAESAIVVALSIDKENDKANLEFARIKKAQGKSKEYQQILKKILKRFKDNYRDLVIRT